MRKTLFFFIIFLSSWSLSAQLIPVLNSDEDIQSVNVKSLSTNYTSPIDNQERLIFRKEFNQGGNVVNQYQLSLWEAISYSRTTTFRYNDKGQIVSKVSFQEFLNLFDRDEDYLHFFGDTPLHEKRMHYYNDQEEMSKKVIYTFSENEPDQYVQPNQSIDYEYEKGLLISEESRSLDDKFFNQNYLIKYAYDSAGNLIHKTMAYGKEKDLQRNFIFKYNGKGHMTEEQVIDFAIPHNNTHLKYEYNDDGQKSKKYIFNETEEVFEEDTSYQYDKEGNAIAGDREVKFEYYDNGLIKSESWTDPTSTEQINFTTKYEYF